MNILLVEDVVVTEDPQLDEELAKVTGDFSKVTDPFDLFAEWFGDAEARELNDPNAMTLATVDENGLPNARIVLLKAADDAGAPERGFVFYTNTESAKGRELETSPKAALLFHWKSLRRQVRIRGSIKPVSAEEADCYFASRPRMSQIGAWASDQSRPLASRVDLHKKVATLEKKYEGANIPRPHHWSGYRLLPIEMEFWHSRLHRLHDRVVFRRPQLGGDWSKSLLYP